MDKKLISEIVVVLKKNEEFLSDGYGYYCGADRVYETLERIAYEIGNLLTQRAVDGLTAAQKEEVRQMIQSALDTGSA